MTRGSVITERFPQCGKCEQTFPDYKDCSYYRLIASMKKDGWVWTRKDGWVCLDCQGKR